MCEKSLEMCICLWPELDCPVVTLCGWQDIKIQLLLLLLCHCPPCTCVYILFCMCQCPPSVCPVLSVSVSPTYTFCFVCVNVPHLYILFCLCQCPPCSVYISCFVCVTVLPVRVYIYILFCLCHCPPSIHPVLSVSVSTLYMSYFVCVTGGRDSSVVRVLDTWLKVTGFKSLQEWQEIFFSSVSFLCWLVFWYRFHPCVTTVARKRSQSFCQKCRWQVTAKHAYTLRMWLCMKWHGAWLYGVHRTCAEMAADSCGTSHASTVSTPLQWIFKKVL